MTNNQNIFLLFLFCIMLIQMVGFSFFLKRKNISMAGISPIHPVLFKTAKAAMMLCWVALFVQATEIYTISTFSQNDLLTTIAIVFWGIGVLLQLLSYINLGKNLKFGIPNSEEQKQLTLKTKGIYRISRNPMYVGFYLMTLGSCFYVLNPEVWMFALFSIIVHHCIVLKEEAFLKKTFGNEWLEYAKQVRRYL
ncbi:MAG: isoprenylcysteine carboxylmethyltransferase family protein [Bacteroidia bacterium]|nr:isoprenylcysteine carboxylmethyltransferase family protein [Bacteroidia bacterium]